VARASRSRSLGAREGTVASQGRLLRRAGAVALIAGFTIKVALRFVDDPHFLTWLSGIASLVLIACGAFMLYRGRQWAAAERSLAASTHAPEAAPVVYLRSFALDESGRSRVLRALLFGFLTQAPFVQVRTEEEQLARAFAPIGPLIGLGEPREARRGSTPPNGTRASKLSYAELDSSYCGPAYLKVCSGKLSKP